MTASISQVIGRFRSIAGVAAAVALVLLMAALLAGTLPTWFGYQSFAVYGGSMAPAINVGDLAVVAPARAEDLRVGDVITYRQPDKADVVVTHRIIGIEADASGRKSFVTKGDSNNTTDQVAVDSATVLGRVAYVLPKLGYLVDFARRAEGKVLLIGVPGLLLLGMDLIPVLRRRRGAAAADAASLIAQARAALQTGDRAAALALCDRAIAADPHAEDAWLLKAECVSDPAEALAYLHAGATVNPHSERLRQAADRLSQTARVAVR